MKIAMIAIGSTGDVQPYLVLARELRARGHEISIGAFSDFKERVEGEGFRFCPINADVRNFMNKIMSGNNGVQFLKQVSDSLGPVARPLLKSLEDACEGAEAIISTYFGEVIMSIAEVNHVPYIQTQYYPMDRNSTAPMATAPNAGAVWNLVSYQLGYLLIGIIEKYYLADWRAEHGMSPRKISESPNYIINGHKVPVLYIMSPLVMPRPRQWDENIHMTGYLLDKPKTDFEPSPELLEFLSKDEAPIYIGFGSMVSNDMGRTLKVVLDALDMCGTRAVISRGWGGVIMEPRDNVFVVDYVPHEWLFPRVSAVVHHGGAGTTAAGILAGKPTLVIPFGGDQPFWGSRVRELGIGPKAIPHEQLTARKLAKAITNLTRTKRYAVAARELGACMANENGTLTAANVVEHELRRWLREEGKDPAAVPKHE